MSDGTYNPQAFARAKERFERGPAQLTDEDVAQLGTVDASLARRALEMRAKALREAPPARFDVDTIAAALIDIIAANIKPLAARLEEQQRRIAVLERQPALKFVGPYRDGTHYLAGSITQRQGLWLAEADTHATPGEADSGWRLILKAAPK
jgi:hypothetical protein